MALQNRVNPWGELVAVPAKGTLMGNRGQLHDQTKVVVRHSARLPWVTCALSFNGSRRRVFGDNSYSELFFLDEATALAAGHRPCATCRRGQYVKFKQAWLRANSTLVSRVNPPMTEIDAILHAERLSPSGEKRTFSAKPSTLPSGAIVEIEGAALLLWQEHFLRWSFDGYASISKPIASVARVNVLTPRSVVRALAAGYTPMVHASVTSP